METENYCLIPSALKSLRAFCLVMETGSVKNAALSTFVSTSAVSYQLIALERHLKKQLFIRKARKLVPTEQAQVFYKKIKPLIDLLDLTIEQTRNSAT